MAARNTTGSRQSRSLSNSIRWASNWRRIDFAVQDTDQRRSRGTTVISSKTFTMDTSRQFCWAYAFQGKRSFHTPLNTLPSLSLIFHTGIMINQYLELWSTNTWNILFRLSPLGMSFCRSEKIAKNEVERVDVAGGGDETRINCVKRLIRDQYVVIWASFFTCSSVDGFMFQSE